MGKAKELNLVFYNPHLDDFLAEPPHFRLFKRRALKKYAYLFESELRKNGRLKILFDETASVFVPDKIFKRMPKFLRKLIAKIEIQMWVGRNSLEGKLVRVKGGDKDSVLFTFSYKAARGRFVDRLAVFNQFNQCLFHLSHYFVATSEKANHLKLVSNLILVGDSDLSNNRYFQTYFGWYKRPLLILPFAVADRFQAKKPFELRQAKIIATGTFHNLLEERPKSNYVDFINFFSSTAYHPTRKLVYEHQSELGDILDCRVNFYRAGKNGVWKGLLSRFQVSQASYFKIDLVDLYNDYQVLHVGEELSGFPGVGAFEGMACGAVLIGCEAYYQGLELFPWVHFIPYDGSLAGLRSAMKFIRENPQESKTIAAHGIEWTKRLRGQELANQFETYLGCLTDDGPRPAITTNSNKL